jgi:hypothetical protein
MIVTTPIGNAVMNAEKNRAVELEIDAFDTSVVLAFRQGFVG